MKAIILIDGQAKNKEELAEIMGSEDVLLTVEIEQWLRLVKDAAFVLTDSYHGCCFSIINHKNFVAIKNRKRGNSRFETLFSSLDLYRRLVDSADDIMVSENNYLFEESINYDKCDMLLKKKIEEGIEWLKDKVFSPKQPIKYYELLYQLIKNQEKRINELEMREVKTCEKENN